MPVSGGIIYDFLKKLNASYEWNVIKKVKQIRNKNNKKKFLDLACGKGYLIQKISRNLSFECVGIDINQIEKKKKKN